MTGYAAMARLDGSRVRAIAWDGRVPDADPGPDLDERWDRFRDQVSMTAFFLLDPESWR